MYYKDYMLSVYTYIVITVRIKIYKLHGAILTFKVFGSYLRVLENDEQVVLALNKRVSCFKNVLLFGYNYVVIKKYLYVTQ